MIKLTLAKLESLRVVKIQLNRCHLASGLPKVAKESLRVVTVLLNRRLWNLELPKVAMKNKRSIL